MARKQYQTKKLAVHFSFFLRRVEADNAEFVTPYMNYLDLPFKTCDYPYSCGNRS